MQSRWDFEYKRRRVSYFCGYMPKDVGNDKIVEEKRDNSRARAPDNPYRRCGHG